MNNYVIQGAGGGGGSSKGGGDGGVSTGAVEDADSLQSREMVAVLDLLGEGQIGGLVNGGKSIFLNDVPLINADDSYNFNGVTFDARTGAQDQTIMQGFSDVETSFQVGVTVSASTPYILTINNPNIDAVRIILAVPTLISQDTSNGNVHGSSVDYNFEVSTNGGAFVQFGSWSISGKSRSKYQRAHMLYLPKPGTTWTIRTTRLTADSTSSAIANELTFDSYVEVVNSPLTYPNSALVGVRIDSSLFNSIPSRSYLVNGLYIRVPTNYDPVAHTYAGTWDGTFKLAVSNNPAWVLYDLLTQARYGLGNFITDAQVDKAKLYQIGRYCDEMVSDGFASLEPRFTINTCIQTQADAYKVVSDITSVFRGMAYWNGSMVGFTQDAPSDPTMIYTPANVVSGTFNYSGTARKDRHSVVLVTWNDPAENYKQKIEYVEDADLISQFGVRKLDTVAFGCNSRGQAARAGRWILYTEHYESNLITFKVGIDSSLTLPGEVIRIVDPMRAGKRMGGRIVGITSTSVTVDAPVTIAASGAVISMRLPDGTFVDRPLSQLAGTYTTFTWPIALATLPIKGAMWIVAEPNLQPILARVISLAQDGTSKTEYNIGALLHNPSKYALIEQGLLLENQIVSIVDSTIVSKPINFVAAESTYLAAPNVLGNRVSLSWYGTSTSYEVKWRRVAPTITNWTVLTLKGLSIELDSMQLGDHEFEVRGMNVLGRRSQAVTLTYTVHGKITPPNDVANFSVTERVTDLQFSWSPNPDIDLARYELRQGPSWDAGTVVVTGLTDTSAIDDQSEAGTYHYHIRAYDPSGNWSANVTSLTLILAAPVAVSNFVAVQSGARIEFAWDANPENNIVGYEIREGASWKNGALICQNLTTVATIPAGATAIRNFWITAIAPPGIYGTVPVLATTAISLPSDANVLYVADEHATGFLNTKIRASVATGDLVMDAGYARSEYLFPVDLSIQFLAQNTLFLDAYSTITDTADWTNTPYLWSSTDAERDWVVSSLLSSIATASQISTYQGLIAGETDGFGMHGTTTSISGVTPTTAIDITYNDGRYGPGVFLHDGTTLDYAFTTPVTFAETFWITLGDIVDQTYWELTGPAGIGLTLGYDTASSSFYLKDESARSITVPKTFATGDRLLFGIVQTATTRKLMIGDYTANTAVEASAAYAANGAAYTSMNFD